MSHVLLRAQSDERLAVLVGDGNEQAFSVLVERHRRGLLAFLSARVGREQGEDVLQQSFMQAWVALRRGPEIKHVRGWLFQIVRHAAWRSSPPSAAGELAPTLMGADSPQVELEQRLRVQQIVEEVAKLPDRQREALVQTALEGRSRTDVAMSLGVSEGAVGQLIHRGRERLRQAAGVLVPFPLLRLVLRGHHGGARVGPGVGGASTGLLTGASKLAMIVLATGTVAVGARASIDHVSATSRASTANAGHPSGSAAGRSGSVDTAGARLMTGRSASHLAVVAAGGHASGTGDHGGSHSAAPLPARTPAGAPPTATTDPGATAAKDASPGGADTGSQTPGDLAPGAPMGSDGLSSSSSSDASTSPSDPQGSSSPDASASAGTTQDVAPATPADTAVSSDASEPSP